MSSWKIIASILSLVDKLSDWWHDHNIRKNERKLVEKEMADELLKNIDTAKDVRADLDSNSDNADRVRDKFTRK